MLKHAPGLETGWMPGRRRKPLTEANGRIPAPPERIGRSATEGLPFAHGFSAAKAMAEAMGAIKTSDGVTLRYVEAGSGRPLVMVPGWSQTAAQFEHQLAGLSDRYRVIALDLRGHGESGFFC